MIERRTPARIPLLLWGWGAIGILLLATASCGRKGDPLPPELRRPGPPRAVGLAAPGGRLTLSWSPPREDLGGRALPREIRYRVLKAGWRPGLDPCESCPEDLKVAAELDPLLRQSQNLPETAWADPDVLLGWTYRYRVQATDSRGRPGPASEAVGITWLPLPAPVAEAVPGDREVLLRSAWPPMPEGLEPLGFRAYDVSGRRVATSEPGAADLRVAGIPNDVPWEGALRLAAGTPEGWDVESPGAPVSATPEDRTPPLPPGDLVALVEPSGVRLHWAPSGAEPYAAVLVLRAEEGEFQEIARLPGWAVSADDPSAEPGHTYRYTVRALDAAGNKSLPAREVVVRPR